MCSAESINSLMRELQPLHDQCLAIQDEEMEDEDMYDASFHHVLPINSSVMPVIYRTPIPEEHNGLKRQYSDSGNISLSTGSNEYKEEMMMEIDNSGPLVVLNISSGDFRIESTSPTLQYTIPQLPGSTMIQAPPVSQQGPIDMMPPILHPEEISPINEVLPANTPSNDLPPDCEMELSVSYLSSQCIVKKVITHPDGFLLFHKKAPEQKILPKKCEYISFPPLPTVDRTSGKKLTSKGNKEPSSSPRDQKNIQNIIDNMLGGLQVRCHQGCIYATRRSKAKIFYKSYNTSDDVALEELPRNTELMIFNSFEHRSGMQAEYLNSTPLNVKSAQSMNPTIYFTFAQKWVSGTVPLNKCLVWAKLTPSKALHIWDGLFHPKENGIKTSINSYNGLLQLSADSYDCNKI